MCVNCSLYLIITGSSEDGRTSPLALSPWIDSPNEQLQALRAWCCATELILSGEARDLSLIGGDARCCAVFCNSGACVFVRIYLLCVWCRAAAASKPPPPKPLFHV